MHPEHDADVDLDDADGPLLAHLVLEAGGAVIYDPENHRAWIQSDAAVELSESA